jgi:hypothetical protein
MTFTLFGFAAHKPFTSAREARRMNPSPNGSMKSVLTAITARPRLGKVIRWRIEPVSTETLFGEAKRIGGEARQAGNGR